MINKVTFEKSDSILVISKSEDDYGMEFVNDLVTSINDVTLLSVSFETKKICFRKVSSYSFDISFNNKVLVKNGSIVMIDCSCLIDHKILNLR